ncbi:MAG: M12 family metallopeptidase [Bacteroidota bacterium]
MRLRAFRLSVIFLAFLSIPFGALAQRNLDTVVTVQYRFHENEPAQPLQVWLKGDRAFLGDDILLGDARTFLNKYNRSAIINGNHRRWPNNTIPYEIEPNHPEENAIRQAILYVKARTNLKMVERSGQENYVRFISTEEGCFSSIGMVGGQQVINMSGNCGVAAGIHEIGHAIGLFHEQSRRDRDDYIIINWDEIEEGKEHNFQKYSALGRPGTDYDVYDYGSIMHYGNYGFSKSSRPTISLKYPPAKPETEIGRSTKLSAIDILTINAMYRVLPPGDETLLLAEELSVETGPLCIGTSARALISIRNLASEPRSGQLQLFLYDKNTGVPVQPVSDPLDFDLMAGQQMPAQYLALNPEGLSPGQYLLSMWELNSSGNPDQLIGNGDFLNGKLIELVEDCAALAPDTYEFNDLTQQPFLFAPTSADSTIVLQTEQANIHTLNDIDYYELDLPKGRNYYVRTEVYDEERSLPDVNFDNDVLIEYYDPEEGWQGYQDERLREIFMPNGRSGHFRVRSHFPDQRGSYRVEWTVETDPKAMLEINEEQISLSHSDTLYVLELASNRDWQLTETADWMELSKDAGSGFDTLYLRLSPNEDFDERTSLITLQTTNDAQQQLSLLITVRQAGKPVVLESELNFNPVCFSASQAVIWVRSNTDWLAESQSEWITILNEPQRSMNDYLLLAVSRNFEGADRIGSILLSAGDVQETLSIFQPSNQGVEACADPVYVEVGPAAGSVIFELNTNEEWSWLSASDWLSNLSAAAGSGDVDLEIGYNDFEMGDSNRLGRVDLEIKNYGLLTLLINQGADFGTSVQNAAQQYVSEWELWPNPAVDLLQLQFHLAKATPLQLTLHNALGQVVRREQLTAIGAGMMRYNLSVAQLPAGSYYLQLSGADFTLSRKLVIMRR